MPATSYLKKKRYVEDISMGEKDSCGGRGGGMEAATLGFFCFLYFFLVRESLFLSGKCQGILNTDVHSNHDKTIHFCCLHRGFIRPRDSAAQTRNRAREH